MEPLQLSDMFSMANSQGSRFHVSVSNGNVVVLPVSSSAHQNEEPSRRGAGQQAAESLDHQLLNGADESLADLEPEASDGEDTIDNDRGSLTDEQQKVEFMASLGLVPPAVLEEIQRRQELCRMEYGNWWDRLHSTDFCLVPKNEAVLSNIENMNEGEMGGSDYPIIPAEDQSQVATGPDAGSLVEQITYLTSWPQTERQEVVEVTTPYN